MSDTITTHPPEETLYRCALNDCDEVVRKHLAACEQCRAAVEEIRLISNDIAALGDMPVPGELDEAVLSITRHSGKRRMPAALKTWFINPLTLGILALGLILFTYAVLISLT